jgi:hypothetical protein
MMDHPTLTDMAAALEQLELVVRLNSFIIEETNKGGPLPQKKARIHVTSTESVMCIS